MAARLAHQTLPRAFTLAELLIVLVIIGILAALAIPRLNEAAARSKVSRVKSELRLISEAVEAYHVDTNHIPNGNQLGLAPPQLSTPVAYLSAGFMTDPFSIDDPAAQQHRSEQWKKYRYNGFLADVDDTADDLDYKQAMQRDNGSYWLYANGPALAGFREQIPNTQFTTLGAYDPTNGVISPGRIIRREKQ